MTGLMLNTAKFVGKSPAMAMAKHDWKYCSGPIGGVHHMQKE